MHSQRKTAQVAVESGFVCVRGSKILSSRTETPKMGAKIRALPSQRLFVFTLSRVWTIRRVGRDKCDRRHAF